MQNLPSATLCTALHPPLLKASLQIAAFQVHPELCIPYMCRACWLQNLYLFFFCNSGLLKVYVFRSICFCCVYISGLLKRYVYIPDPGRTHSGICVCCVCDLISGLREGLNKKKRFLSGVARMRGGVYPCPNFSALFQEVHFWSIKRVYFFKNANELLTVF